MKIQRIQIKCRKKITSFDHFNYLIQINQDQVDIMLNYHTIFTSDTRSIALPAKNVRPTRTKRLIAK